MLNNDINTEEKLLQDQKKTTCDKQSRFGHIYRE